MGLGGHEDGRGPCWENPAGVEDGETRQTACYSSSPCILWSYDTRLGALEVDPTCLQHSGVGERAGSFQPVPARWVCHGPCQCRLRSSTS